MVKRVSKKVLHIDTPEPAAAVRWPRSTDLCSWLMSTAAWAARVPSGADERCYATFALDELSERNFFTETARVIEWLLASRCESDLLRRVTEDEWLVDALLRCGKSDEALTILREVAAIARRQSRKSARHFCISSLFELVARHGVAAGDPKPFRTANQRLTHLDSILDSPGVSLRVPPKHDPHPANDPPVDLASEARRRIEALSPSEWNLHDELRPLESTAKALSARGDLETVRSLVVEAVDKLSSGVFDQREFASAASCNHMARAANLCSNARACEKSS